MYLHLGNNVIIPFSGVIGVFDLDITSQSRRTRYFLGKEERAKRVINVSDELPKSFIIYDEKEKKRVYISQISPQTLQKRAENGIFGNYINQEDGGKIHVGDDTKSL